MKRSEAKKGALIKSSSGYIWEIVWRYSSTMLLIKPISEEIAHMKTVVLNGGQFKFFKVVESG